MRLLQRYVRFGEINHAAKSVVESGREIVGELALQHEAEAIGIEGLASIGERAGGDVGQNKPAHSRSFASAKESRIAHAIGIGRDLEDVFDGDLTTTEGLLALRMLGTLTSLTSYQTDQLKRSASATVTVGLRPVDLYWRPEAPGELHRAAAMHR